ncbi:MAG: DUF1428 domain-containing protein [Ignavibacteriales bacterium]|nr:DUF1428 domain-containing protein [Ignavibacteriales bacterium]
MKKGNAMKGYVDVYLLPLPKRNLAAYRRLAQKFGRIARLHGVLKYREFTGDDLFTKGVVSFTHNVRLRRGEIIVAAVVDFKSRTHRDRVMKKLFADPRLNDMMKDKPLFNPKKMVYGGFKTFVSK